MNRSSFIMGVTTFGAVGALGALGACDDKQGNAPPRGLDISVAPLNLPGIGEAVYTIEVDNADGETVWRQTGLKSTRFGDSKGSLAYVGTCDASAKPNAVHLTLTGLFDSNGRELKSPHDFVNPTPVVIGDVTCVENGDVPVTFNLVMMRNAAQGFFDVAVSFEDIFCSAKVDCQAAFLHDLAPHGDDERGPSAVMAFACTSGKNEATTLYLSNVSVDCVDPHGGAGRHYAIPLGAPGNGEASPADEGIFGTGLYYGRELLPDLDKCYVDMALGLDYAALGDDVCTLHASGSASPTTLGDGLTPPGTVYPVVAFDVVISDGTGNLCAANKLDATGSGVRTGYTVDDAGQVAQARFAWQYPCGGAVAPVGIACPADGGSVVFTPAGDDQVVIAVDGHASDAYELPAGATIDGCCADRCCAGPPL